MTKYITVHEVHRKSGVVAAGKPIDTSGEEEAFLLDAKAIRKMTASEKALYGDEGAEPVKAEKPTKAKASKAEKPADPEPEKADPEAGKGDDDDAGLV